MNETLSACPLCNSGQIGSFLEVIDHSVSGETFGVSKCTNCGLLFTNPRPDISSIGKYYETDDYISHSNSNKGLINRIYQSARHYAINRKVQLIEKTIGKIAGKRLLDIGCGTGEFLSSCQNKGAFCEGIEPNAGARSLAIKNYWLKVSDLALLETKTDQSEDVITMWHVLEHVHDLRGVIRHLFRLLEEGGHCFIALPNPTSYDAKKYGEKWAAFDVPRHLYHFRPEVVSHAFSTAGFEHIASFPMKLDAFYVSLLSEKYNRQGRAGAGAMMAAFSTGLRSNLAAHKPVEYSSVIYVFRKPGSSAR
jgi:ubiquinone/menaquinone biosynthesis C-methylase UbiE